MKGRAPLLALLLLTTPFAGCFGWGAADEEVKEAEEDDVFTNETLKRVEKATDRSLRFEFPGANPPDHREIAWFNGTVGTEANTAYEDPQDRGGTSVNTVLQTGDFSDLVPENQPTLINIRLWYDNKPGASADLDIFVDAYETRTHENREYHGEMAWTLPVKTKSVATIGLEDTLIGIQAANGRVQPGNELPFWMRIEFLYGDNVAAPKVPYALDVPTNASGLIVESLKFAGDTHVQGRFLVVDPDGGLVRAVDFDDLNIPTQSIYVPLPGPGTYVFYVVDVVNGFFRVQTDANLENTAARPLERTVETRSLFTEPVEPGLPHHQVYDEETPTSGGTSVEFSVDAGFPLELRPVLIGDGFAGDVHLAVENQRGEVGHYHRFLRHDQGEERVGVSDDGIDENRIMHAENLGLGAHELHVIADGMYGLEAGVEIVSFTL